MEEKRGRGRPAKQEGMKAHPLHIYFPSEEAVALIKEAAELDGQGVSTWARSVLLREARRVLGKSE